ncbi:MAG: ABC transporter ATP-binding protein [Caldilineaceae bacterium]
MARFVQPYRWVMTMALLLVVLPVAMDLVVPRLLEFIIDKGIRANSMAVVIQGSVIMLLSAVIGAVATLGQGVYRARLSQGIAYDMRNEMFTHIQALSFANLDEMQTGQLMTRISSDVDVVRGFISAGLALILRAVITIAGSVVLLLMTDLQLSVIIIFLLCVAGLMIRWIMQTATPLFSVVQQKLAALNTIVQENFAGAQVVKAFVRERFEMDRFATRNLAYVDQNIKVGRMLALAMPVLTVITNLGIVAVIWWGGVRVIGGRLSVGQLIAFNNYLLIGMSPLLLLSNMLTMISRAEASAVRIWEVLDTQPAIQPAPSPYKPEKMKGQVVFNNVSFHYAGGRTGTPQAANGSVIIREIPKVHVNGNGNHNGAPHPNGVHLDGHDLNGNHLDEQYDVLDNVSFAVEAGQRVALLGATGSGKSTLVNLIPRFYDVTGGQISIDGVDLRTWGPEKLRSRIGVVLQQNTLFSGTVRENIAYGRPDAGLDEVIAAAQAAQAHDFIMAMPDGYDSQVEARGANLSGGQKQRIAIARALLISPTILIMDDSTSAVDMETEFRLQEALDKLMAGRTTFIVAQRINSVLNADQILVLDRGHVVAQGSHRQLLATSPIYQDIYRSQLGEESFR